jgi:UTP:GlnB (protein PII) uridylyltransferase
MSAVAEKIDIPLRKNLHLSCVPRKDTTLLKVTVSGDEIGIIYRVTAVLYAHGWDILEAMAETSHEGTVQDVFVVKSQTGEDMTEKKLRSIREDLNSIFYQGVSAFDYMEQKELNSLHSHRIPDPTAVVKLYNPVSSDFTVMDIRMKDRPGVLFQITQILHFFGIDIITFSALSNQGQIRDSFLIRTQDGNRLDEGVMFSQLKSAIENIL